MFKKIYIEITNVCNLNCRFCPDTKREKKFMSASEFENIIKKVCKYTNLVCLHVKGEPLLHNDLERILNILEKYNLKANITTNGTLLKEKLDILKKSNVLRQLNISIHSISQNKEMSNLYLNDIFKCSEQLSNVIVSYRLWNLDSFNNIEENNSVIKEFEKFYNITNLYEKLKEKNFFKVRENLFINQDLRFEWPNILGKEINKSGRCLALKEQIAILVDGTVVPCCLDNNGDIPLGNVFKQTLEEILSSTRALTIKRNFENNIIPCNLCKTCGFLQRLENKRKKKNL